MTNLQLVRDVHLVRDTEIARFLRRETGCEDWLTYYHTQANAWVIALWSNRSAGLVREVEVIGPHLGLFDRTMAQSLTYFLRSDIRANLRQIAEEERRAERENVDNELGLAERRDWLRRKYANRRDPRLPLDAYGFSYS